MVERDRKYRLHKNELPVSGKEIGESSQPLPSHAEEINRVLYAISDAVNSTQDLDELYRTIHQILGTIIDVTNFFIAIVDRHKRTLYFPYHVDTVDDDFTPLTDFETDTSLTGLVAALKKPVLLHTAELHERAARQGIWGPVPLIWMGVPLLIREEVIGVMAVQNYIDADVYDETDLRLLMAISQQTAIAIDRKRSLEELKRSEETYRNIFLNAPVGLFRVNPVNGIVEDCNDAMARMLGFVARHECVGHYSLKKACFDQLALQKMEEMVEREGEIKNFEAGFLRQDGTEAWLRFSAKIDNYNKLLEGVSEDISNFKAANEEKQKLQEQLNRSKRMEAVGLLAGGVAHDLNNMLSGIINYPELMLMKLDKDHELVRPIKAVQESGKRIAMVVDDLLTLARSAASVRETHSLNTLVDDYLSSHDCRMLRSRYPGLKVDVQLSSIRPNISCSAVHVRRCLMNLFANAIEAVAGKGTVAIATANQPSTTHLSEQNKDNPGTEWVALIVGDTGPGIADKDINHIFEPFYTRKVMGTSGTGLGLTVVWSTMEDHQGKVMVASDKDGTTFTLLFPATGKTINSSSSDNDPQSLRGSGQSILVVDDEAQLRDVAGTLLSMQGYKTYQAPSGEEAVAFIKRKCVDLVVLDMLMEPGWNGRRTYEEILKVRPQQKAIIISGYSEGEDVRACLTLGVGRFVKKPYSLEQLCIAVYEELAR
ncbi:MAG: response regulator [Proteobacteria bacterium]|nr:response regulator [Pseudomonadota bacterium]